MVILSWFSIASMVIIRRTAGYVFLLRFGVWFFVIVRRLFSDMGGKRVFNGLVYALASSGARCGFLDWMCVFCAVGFAWVFFVVICCRVAWLRFGVCGGGGVGGYWVPVYLI